MTRIAAVSRIRIFIAWVLLAVLPLQGLAAASMAYCASAPGHGAAAARVTAHASASPSELHHASTHHAGTHDAGTHDHHAAALPEKPQASDAADTLQPPTGHGCALCASLCHAAAMSSAVQTLRCLPPEQLAITEPEARVPRVPASVPDKPPRA